MGTHLRELNESYKMDTNMTGLRWISETFAGLEMKLGDAWNQGLP